jgi:hypothetical protein
LKKKLLLHIGYPKTATTTLQEEIFMKLHKKGKINYLGRTTKSSHTRSGKSLFRGIDWVWHLRQYYIAGEALKKGSISLSSNKLNVMSDEDLTFHDFFHNAQFDRAFFESTFPNVAPKAWACSMRDINWNDEDIISFKLEYIAYRYNFFFEGHRAIIDCLAGIHILAQNLINSQKPVLKRLLDNAMQLEFKLWAKNEVAQFV